MPCFAPLTVQEKSTSLQLHQPIRKEIKKTETNGYHLVLKLFSLQRKQTMRLSNKFPKFHFMSLNLFVHQSEKV